MRAPPRAATWRLLVGLLLCGSAVGITGASGAAGANRQSAPHAPVSPMTVRPSSPGSAPLSTASSSSTRASPAPRDPSQASAPVHGIWLAPEWIFPGGKGPSSEAEARVAVDATLDRLAAVGVDTLFMESLLRGYGIAPFAGAQGGGVPVYQLCRIPGSSTDLMSIVLASALGRGMRVHAWVHTFFFRTDNPDLGRESQGGASIFGDLIAEDLRAAAQRAAGPDRDLLASAADIALRDLDITALARLVSGAGLDPREGPLNVIDRVARKAGVTSALFVRLPSGDIHPPRAKDPWMSLYFDPANTVVQDRLLAAIRGMCEAHPALAGVHLDHIRYPRGPLALPPELAGLKVPGTFPGGLGGAVYKKWRSHLRAREDTLRAFVGRVRDVVPAGMLLSAAVHPLYYHNRDDWADQLTDDDFIGQDWVRWGLDLAVPMIYDSDPARVGRVIKKYRFELSSEDAALRAVHIVPGTNLFGLTQAGGGLKEWVYFDFDQFKSLREGRAPPQRERESGSADAAAARGASAHSRGSRARRTLPAEDDDDPAGARDAGGDDAGGDPGGDGQ